VIGIACDVMCPWCRIGYRQRARALQRPEGEIAAPARWRPFGRKPQMPQHGGEQEAYLQRKYRRPTEEAARIGKQHSHALGRERAEDEAQPLRVVIAHAERVAPRHAAAATCCDPLPPQAVRRARCVVPPDEAIRVTIPR
jgi:predicted DsbA family dithiol-disulfide isomerase